jgi:Acyclic terpene utilisation family protein AtuA
VSVNAYLGAEGIAAALQQNARIVITGRVADASLTVGPCMAAFGTDWHDWNTLAGYSVAGHLIECGAQVTGGYAVDWSHYDLHDVGYPIAELTANGDCVITKPPGSGGAVNRRTVTEQLVYEIGDPQHYLTPDVDCNFTTVELAELEPNRVCVTGATGAAAPDTYKVSLAYRDGFMASGMLLVAGNDCLTKAQTAADIVKSRLELVGYAPQRWHVELLGQATYGTSREVVLRITMHDERREAVERFTRELAPLITSGPAGIAGYAAGRPAIRPVYAYWPTRISKRFVPWQTTVKTVQEWQA